MDRPVANPRVRWPLDTAANRIRLRPISRK